MPICPRCSATIHAGADDQCPACRYNLQVANDLFGEAQVEFTRVVDSAGILTHPQRQELLEYLENLERDIPPVALCVYITDDGAAKDFRLHAHWILNHAHIHHASFGRREKDLALDDAELRLRIRKDAAEDDALPPEPEPLRAGWLTRIRNYLRDALHPNLPPPVQQRWMLILVLDVQLECACFSWGYQLDPYINPDSINSCILGAKFQFRERAILTGLKLVMKKAARQIAASTHRVNNHLRRTGRLKSLGAALAASLMLAAAAEPCAAQAAPPALPADDVAEEVAPEAATPAPAEGDAPAAAQPATPAPAPEPGSPATYAAQPRWEDGDYRHLMAGELANAYSLLFPPADTPRAETRFRTPSSSRESDRKIPTHYHAAYKTPPANGLIDPQGLLTVEEARDVVHVLRELNANGRYRIHVAVYRAGQQLPPELSVHHLTQSSGKDIEYVTLILFPLGNAQMLDLGYRRMEPTDEQRHAWLRRVRDAAAPEGDGVESLLLAIHEVCSIITPLSHDFLSSNPEPTTKLDLVNIDIEPIEKEKKVPVKDIIKAYILDEANHPLMITVASLILFLAAAVTTFMLMRRTGTLLESREDARLSSPYGAGVSRHVRYLEGKEAPREPNIY